MLKYLNAPVTFAEVPDEITLCINITGCPLENLFTEIDAGHPVIIWATAYDMNVFADRYNQMYSQAVLIR